MQTKASSFLALLVGKTPMAPHYQSVFTNLVTEHETLPGTMGVEVFEDLKSFLNAQRQRHDLGGIVADPKLISESTPELRKALDVLESLGFPLLKVGQDLVQGDAVSRELLRRKWGQMLAKMKTFSPRGLRAHSRKICFVKLRYRCAGKATQEFQRAVTYDLSPGGCFVISMEEWNQEEEIELFFGDMEKPIVCRVAWRLPWGEHQYRLPGIGVQFTSLTEEQRKELSRYFQSPDPGGSAG